MGEAMLIIPKWCAQTGAVKRLEARLMRNEETINSTTLPSLLGNLSESFSEIFSVYSLDISTPSVAVADS